MGKKEDLGGFERGQIVGARRAGLSISKTADLFGFSRTTVSRVYREWLEKQKTSSERKLCGRKCLVDVSGQKTMDRVVRGNRKATVAEITARYNQESQNTISERTARRTLKQMGHSRRPRKSAQVESSEDVGQSSLSHVDGPGGCSTPPPTTDQTSELQDLLEILDSEQNTEDSQQNRTSGSTTEPKAQVFND